MKTGRSSIVTALLCIPIFLLFAGCQSTSDGSNGPNDAIRWEKAAESGAFSPRSLHQVVEFRNKLFLIAGRDTGGQISDAWLSDDGVKWSPLAGNIGVPVDYGALVTVFNDRLWMNANKTVWSSDDGITWSREFSDGRFPRYGKSMVAFNGKLWLLGGWENGFRDDVWSSEDGKNWTKEITPSCFSPRADHSVFVFRDKLWLIGGQSGQNKSDVWCSADGTTWSLVADKMFPARHSFQAVVCDDTMWIVGGLSADGSSPNLPLLSDVWFSSDGKKWTNAGDGPFGGRHEHQAVVFRNRIWVIGGLIADTGKTRNYKNDVWFLSTAFGSAPHPSGR